MPFTNQYNWSKNEGSTTWLCKNRLDGFSHLIANIKLDDKALIKILKRISKSKKPAIEKLVAFASEI